MPGRTKEYVHWSQHICVVSAYSATYEIIRYLSAPHWAITAGLRLICLLLVPRHFWLALIFGEAIPIASMAAMTSPRLGMAWAIVVAIPPMLLCAPIIAWMNRVVPAFRTESCTNARYIITSALLCATVMTISNSTAILATTMELGRHGFPWSSPLALTWILGNFLGAVAIAPAFFALRDRVIRVSGFLTWRHVTQSPLTRDIVLIALPVIGIFLAIAHYAGTQYLVYSRMGLAIPIALLSIRHGWHGAAIAGLPCTLALMSTALAPRDPSLFPAQAIVALVISTGMIIGPALPYRSQIMRTIISPHNLANGKEDAS